jgi:hypothetical protein
MQLLAAGQGAVEAAGRQIAGRRQTWNAACRKSSGRRSSAGRRQQHSSSERRAACCGKLLQAAAPSWMSVCRMCKQPVAVTVLRRAVQVQLCQARSAALCGRALGVCLDVLTSCRQQCYCRELDGSSLQLMCCSCLALGLTWRRQAG